MKKCTKCNIRKQLFEFHKDKRAKDERCSECIKCHSECNKQVYNKKRKYYKEKHKEYYSNNKDIFSINSKQYYKKNKKHILKTNKQWKKNNPIKWKEYNRIYANKKRKEDINYRLKNAMINMLHRTLENKNGKRTIELLGYDTKGLKNHIESMFIKGMTWQNYGLYWEIDHIIPINLFLKIGITEPMKVCKLSNLQPLLKNHNRTKSDKVMMYNIETIKNYI